MPLPSQAAGETGQGELRHPILKLMTTRQRSEEEIYGAEKINLSVEVAHTALTLPLKWWEQSQSIIMLKSLPGEVPQAVTRDPMKHQSDGAAPSLRMLMTISFQVTRFSACISSSLHHIIKFPQSETRMPHSCCPRYLQGTKPGNIREGKRKQTVQEMESGKHTSVL